ncbi:hypothetical protein Tco_0814350 [Tanacetum coccineum]
MASFDYRLNPLYTIKECSSCGALYTTDYCCSNVGSIDKFVRDPNPISYDETPESPSQPQTSSFNQRHCFHCKDPLEEHGHCKRCTCMRCRSGLSKGLCLICASRYGNNPNPNSLNDSPNISENSCGNGAHYGYNCPPKVPFIYNPKRCNNQTVDELPQTLPSFDPTCYSGDGSSFTYDSTPNFINDSPNKLSSAITPDLPKLDSPIMEDEHLDTILETESDELIKSSVEELIHTPSESDGISEGECDLPVCDDSSMKKDEVLDDIISIPPRNGNDHFNAESSPSESMLNRDNVISSP